MRVGTTVGVLVGTPEGSLVGFRVGSKVGSGVGVKVGGGVGRWVGLGVGEFVGVVEAQNGTGFFLMENSTNLFAIEDPSFSKYCQFEVIPKGGCESFGIDV